MSVIDNVDLAGLSPFVLEEIRLVQILKGTHSFTAELERDVDKMDFKTIKTSFQQIENLLHLVASALFSDVVGTFSMHIKSGLDLIEFFTGTGSPTGI